TLVLSIAMPISHRTYRSEVMGAAFVARHKQETTLTRPRGLLYRRRARRSATHRPAVAAATLSPHPKARASTRRVLRRWSGSLAWPWDEWARRPRSARWSESRKQGEVRGL